MAWLFWAGFGGLVLPPLVGWGLPALARLWPERGKPGGAIAKGADQLQAVEGIGPEVDALLREAGIRRFGDLADMRQADLRAMLRDAGPRMAMLEPMSWPVQARLLARGDIENFLKLAVALKGGVPRLEDLHGIGPATGETLRRGGVHSIAALAGMTAGQVRHLTGNGIDEATISGWLAQAGALHDGDAAAIMALAGLTPEDIRDVPRAHDGSGMAAKALPVLSSWLGKDLFSWSIPLKPIALLAAAIMLATLLFGRIAAGKHLPAVLTPACFGAGPVSCAGCDGPCPALPPGNLPPENVPPAVLPIAPMRQTFGADLLFGSGDDRMTDAGAQAIAAMTEAFAERLGDPQAFAITAYITGHADLMRYSGEGGNDGLSLRRAKAVGAALQQRPEMAAARLVASGKGDVQPSGRTQKCAGIADLRQRALCLSPDRRVEVTLIAERTTPE